ncbi:hypothetical protein F5Y09DRAFT_329677 [Xylaria sp. FL1042]|nr:hypothetical protein F5Y09DRAFT_329677 [Xylaria sp. FL1042]
MARYSISHAPPPSSPSPSPRIAIIGAGPAGLTLGILLHKHRIPFTIYEYRARPAEEDYAKPSGMLDLHPATGLAALEACGLARAFRARSVECAEAVVVADQAGSVLWSMDSASDTQPEISRHALTRLLLSKLPGGCVRWGHQLTSARPSTPESSDAPGVLDHQFALRFDDRSKPRDPDALLGVIVDGGVDGDGDVEVTADLVVGADGAWSRTRSTLLDVHKPVGERGPMYSGVQTITLDIADLATRRPSLSALLGPGLFFALGDGNVIIVQRGAGGAARIYLTVSTPEDNLLDMMTQGVSGSSSSSSSISLQPGVIRDMLLGPTTAADEARRRWRNFSTWGKRLKELISVALEDLAETGHGDLDIRGLYMRPVDELAWPHRAGVTLLGDAAHLMTPYAGEGVNLALNDALGLASAITRAWDASIKANDDDDVNERQRVFKSILDPLIQESEKAMITKAEESAIEAWENLQVFIGEDAAKKAAALYQGWYPQPVC